MKRLGLVLIGCVLLMAAVLQVLPRSASTSVSRSRLAQLPTSGVGLVVRDIPMGNTEAAVGNVADILRYDDVVYREYRSQTGAFSLYAAYWGAGKMPTQLVASHTPDRCWTSAGWRCTEQLPDFKLGSTAQILPGEGRVFVDPANSVQHVVYWHLVGDELYDYGDRFNAVPSPWKWWRDAARQIFRAPAEQYFVRLSSAQPFEKLAQDPGLQAVITALAEIGLAAR